VNYVFTETTAQLIARPVFAKREIWFIDLHKRNAVTQYKIIGIPTEKIVFNGAFPSTWQTFNLGFVAGSMVIGARTCDGLISWEFSVRITMLLHCFGRMGHWCFFSVALRILACMFGGFR